MVQKYISDSANCTSLRTFSQFSNIKCVAWSPDGNLLATGADDNTIHLWDMQTGDLYNTLSGHTDWVRTIAWSPDGNMLASGADDNTVHLWDIQTGELRNKLWLHTKRIRSVAWAPHWGLLATGGDDNTVRLWDTQTARLLRVLSHHTKRVRCVAWSPDGSTLATGADDNTIGLWDMQTGEIYSSLHCPGFSGTRCMAWSPDGNILATGGDDNAVRLWNMQTGLQTHTLEGHTEEVVSLSFSPGGQLLASSSSTVIDRADSAFRIWRTDTWENIAMLDEPRAFANVGTFVSFHPKKSMLATHGNDAKNVTLWNLNLLNLLNAPPSANVVYYRNAKVVLVGDSGVGKTGLGLTLSQQPFVPTDSTHGRHIWTLEKKEVVREGVPKETREILLWDLAGQPGYRLIHQLHLNEVTVALVVFDTLNETDPFVGVQYWERALRRAQSLQGDTVLPLKKFLVAARTDRGGVGVSLARIQTLVKYLGFDDYFETSAKEGRGIPELVDAIEHAIAWDMLPQVSSTHLFQSIKTFLVTEKESGRYLSTVEDLYRLFLRSKNAPAESENLFAQFETCVGRLESAGLIKRLSFGNLVLLQPELLDAYASALVNFVKDEPDGLGSITEERVHTGAFRIPRDARLKDREQEKLLLIAMIEDLLRRELVLREEPFLVFPSQSTRKNPDLLDPEGKVVTFRFEGPSFNIYATLAVRLSYSGMFRKKELWQNAITYTATVGGVCGMILTDIGEGCAELTLFFDEAANEQTRFHFEEYVQLHLQRKALPKSIQRRRIFTCDECGFFVTEKLLRKRKEQNFDWIDCPGCDRRISLLDREKRLNIPPSQYVLAMDRAADHQRDREAALLSIQGKKKTKDFDVFLCHHSVDKAAVKKIGEQLKEQGILPWLDEWELPPGRPWQRLLEKQIGQIKSAAVFVGTDGLGPWEHMEIDALLREFIKRDCPIIPVVLANAPTQPQLPIFLEAMTWVDFRNTASHPLQRLIWGITGRRDDA